MADALWQGPRWVLCAEGAKTEEIRAFEERLAAAVSGAGTRQVSMSWSVLLFIWGWPRHATAVPGDAGGGSNADTLELAGVVHRNGSRGGSGMLRLLLRRMIQVAIQ